MAGFTPQTIPVKLTSGVDTKSDPKSLQTSLVTLQNASFQSPGQIEKRDGFLGISQNIFGGGSISKGLGQGSFNNELITLDGSNLYSYSKSLSAHVSRGLMVPTALSVYPVVRNSNQQNYQDSAYHAASGLQIFTYLDSGTSQISYSIIDTATNTLIVNDEPCAPGLYSKVLTLGNNFIVLFCDGSTNFLSYVAINVATPQTVGTETTIANDIYSAVLAFDATVINGSIYVVYIKSSSSAALYSLNSSLALSSQYVVATLHEPDSFAIVGDASNNVWVSCFSAGDVGTGAKDVSCFIVNSALTSTLLTDTVVDSTQNYDNITMTVNGTTASIYYSCQVSNTADFIRSNTITFSGTVGTPALVIRGSYLSSKAFFYNGENYFYVTYYGNPNASLINQPVTIQQTYFLINGSGKVIGKVAPSLAGFYPAMLGSQLPEVLSLSSGVYSFPYLLQENLSASEGVIYYKTGVQNATMNFNVPQSISKEEIGQNLLIAGGQMWAYDGSNINEQGFHIYPEQLTDAVSLTGGGIGSSLNNATVNQVQYKAIYEWQDNQGQLHQSADSPALTVTLPPVSSLTATTIVASSTTGSNILDTNTNPSALIVGQVFSDTTNAGNLPEGTYLTGIRRLSMTVWQLFLSQPATMTESGDTFSTTDVLSIAITIPTLKQTLKNKVSVVLYRTENNQTIFYRVSSLTNLVYNDPTADFVTITDAAPDSEIVGNEQLYTTGGTLPNINPPAVSALTTYKNRAIYLSPENPFQWGYSQQVIGGTPVSFDSIDNVENIDTAIGQATGLLGMDDKLVLFGPSKKFYVVGTGPAPNGSSNDFSDAIPIIGTTGCSNQASILELPDGIIYQDAKKGMWFLDRSLQETYGVGADIEQYGTQQITSSQIFEDHNKAIFTLATAGNIVYDYYVKQWEVDPFATAAVDSTIWENNLTYIQANGLSLVQTPGAYSDNGAVIPIELETGWMSFSSMQAFGRVWELILLGTYFSPHTLNITIYTDFSMTPAQIITIPVLSDPGNYEFRAHMKVQKCTSMKINITETQSGTPGQGFSISGISFLAGMKKGLNKLPAGASF